MNKTEIKESDLFEPVKNYFEKSGYTVHAEVKNSDIAVYKDDEVIIIELKKSISMKLILQGVKRQKTADLVFIAVPIFNSKYNKDYKEILNLLKRLGLGLINIHFNDNANEIEIATKALSQKIKNTKKQQKLIAEMKGRYIEFNTGGAASTVENITSYKQETIKVASFLFKLKESSPAELLKLGTSPKTQSILGQNFYRWFEKKDRGVYFLSDKGKSDLKKYKELVKVFNKQFKEARLKFK